MKEIESAVPLNESTEAQLLAYAYGELSGPEARAFEQRLQADAELRAELESIRATRELLGADARWGLDTKVDAPPPHLLDAIVRAEALARPAEIRNARAMEARPTLTARLSRWLVGGGVLVGATAALLVVVSRSSDQEMMPASPLGAAAPAAAPVAAAEPPMEADGKAADRVAAKEEKPAESAALMADAPASPMPDDAVLQPREDVARPRPNEAQMLPKGGAVGALEKADHGGAGLGAAARGGVTTGAADDEGAFAKDQSVSADPRKAQGQASALGGRAEAEESVRGGDSLGFDGERSPSAAPSSAPSPPPPPPPEPEAVAPSSVASPRRSVASSSAPMTAPDQAPALQERPSSSSLDARTRDELKADRKRLADLRREQNELRQKTNTKSESLSPPADKAPAPKPAPAKSTESAGGEKAKKRAEKAPPVQAGPEAKREMQSEIAYMSGLRELKEGRALDALDEFQSAERLDARRGLGSDPQVGQMRALLALKRPAEALVIARRLAGRNVAEPGVVDGLLLGARTAEQLGDLRSARELWTALLKVPAQKGAAQAALARIGNPAVRSVDTDAAEAASEAPAAAAPASKE